MVDVLETKRAATQFRILVEIAERQPAVNQGEIAEALGVTSQSVSEYIRELVEAGYVEREGRSRYTVTNEGVDWLWQAAADVRQFMDHVTEDVLGGLHEDVAIAADRIQSGDVVGLHLDEGLLTADPRSTDGATGLAVTDASEGDAVLITNFEGVMDLEPGRVTVFQLPSLRTDGPGNKIPDPVLEACETAELVLCAGVEAVAASHDNDLTVDSWLAPGEVAADAARRGLDVAVLATLDHVGSVTNALRDAGIAYDVTDAT